MTLNIKKAIEEIEKRAKTALLKFSQFNMRADSFASKLRKFERDNEKLTAQVKQIAITFKAILDVHSKRVSNKITVEDIVSWMKMIVTNNLSELEAESDGLDLLKDISKEE